MSMPWHPAPRLKVCSPLQGRHLQLFTLEPTLDIILTEQAYCQVFSTPQNDGARGCGARLGVRKDCWG